jgi:CheY-like chemotaxis protein
VVDGDPGVLRLLESVLTSHGYEVSTAPSGRRALDLLRAGIAPGLILIDLEMPFLSAVELRLELSLDPSFNEIPFVMTSDCRETLDRLPSFIRQLEKPFQLQALLTTVEKYAAPVPGGWE